MHKEEFWQDLPESEAENRQHTEKQRQQDGGYEGHSYLPEGAALTQPGFPGDPPQPGYTLPPSPLMVDSPADPQGSWTGVPENPAETPVQDADDL